MNAELITGDVGGFPPWLQLLVATSALIGAVVVLWKQLIRPALRFATSAEEMLPLLRELTIAFRDTPHAFSILDEIVAQFRTDSGSSLRDVVNALTASMEANRQAAETLRGELAASVRENKMAAEVLRVGAEATRQLAVRDREQLLHLILMLDRLTLKVDAGGAGIDRVEAAAGVVASDLAAAHLRADAVALDYDNAGPDRRRSSGPGAAADAASRSPE